MSSRKYSTIWIDTNPTYLLNESGFLNPNTIFLLNGTFMPSCLSKFIETRRKKNSINLINLNYEKPNK